jgi:hypothetical protein
MEDKEKLQQQLQELLNKANIFVNEINLLKQQIQNLENKEIVQNLAPPVTNDEIKKPYVHPIIIKKESSSPPLIVPPPPSQLPKKKFIQPKESNIEKYIGENLINKVGIAILVLGIGFFVKYAIDKNWINEVARMFIGIAAGLILTAFGYWLHKKYIVFSSVLTGGGVATLYFTFFIAFREYGIINQLTTFILMIIVTAFTVLLSIWYDRRELAIIAIIGGFASPLMVSTGAGNYIVLFSYLFILNAGMLVLAYYKKWNEINIITYFFTVLFYGSWLTMNVIIDKRDPYEGALIFGTLFYLMFFAMNIISAFRDSRKFGVFEIIMLTSNTFLFYASGMAIFYQVTSYDYNGIFTAVLGVFNLSFALALFKNQKMDKVFRFLLVGFAITFISLIAPIQFHGNYITLFWATEFVVLFWLARFDSPDAGQEARRAGRSGLEILKIFSFAVLIIVLFSLFLDWMNYYGEFAKENLAVVFNKAFLTGMFVTATLFANILLIKKGNNELTVAGIPTNIYRSILISLFALLFYMVCYIELRCQLPKYIDEIAVRRVIGFSFSGLFFFSFLLYVRRRSPNYVVWIFTGIVLIVTLFYIFSSHFNNIIIRNYYLFTVTTNYWGFFYHYINMAVVLASLFLMYKVIKEKLTEKDLLMQFYLWYLCGALIFLISSELDHITVISFYSSLESIPEILRQTNKIGYPIIWGLSSLIIMIVGLRKKNKMLRIISLSVFGVILLKLFMFDIQGVSAGGKTAAFIILGIILLLVSFLYQKLKKIVFGEDGEREKEKGKS